MKILFLSLHYPPVIGGLETWTKNISVRLSSKAEVFVLAGKVAGEPRKETKNGVKIIRASLFKLRDLSYSSFFYIFTALPLMFFKAYSLIKEEKIDILVCSGFLNGFLGYCLKIMFRIPYIITVQSQQGKSSVKKLVYKNADLCIAASSVIRKYFEQIGCRNVAVSPNGVDLSRFQNLNREQSRKELGLTQNDFVIITVARLEKIKGIEYLIGAIRNFQFSIFNFQLLIVGDGKERKNLENLAQKLGVGDRVRFLGQVPNDKVPQILAAGDCFVLPSLKEGFGIVILEAMAAGLPVIATNVGGIPDIIQDGNNGILIEPANSQAIANAIKQIIGQKDLTSKIIANSWNSLSQYDWDNIANKVFELAKHLIAKN